jgi:hypothetical protein
VSYDKKDFRSKSSTASLGVTIKNELGMKSAQKRTMEGMSPPSPGFLIDETGF